MPTPKLTPKNAPQHKVLAANGPKATPQKSGYPKTGTTKTPTP